MYNNQYENLLEEVLMRGTKRTDRTGVGTVGIFGAQMRFDLSEGFPLITTKEVHFKSVVGELLWFLEGSTNADRLKNKYGVRIWDEWKDEHGELGPIYGKQWRSWDGKNFQYDQIARVIHDLVEDPFSRRHIVSAWNVDEIDDMALPPCHLMFQFHVTPDKDGKPWKLNCQLYQRSADMFLGVPFNIASYALLTHMIAAQVGLEVGDFVHTLGDAHIYLNHLDAVNEQLKRNVRNFPTLQLSLVEGIDNYVPQHISLQGYNPHPAIRGKVAV